MINYEKLNKFQYEAVMHDKGPALLLAGAGTGKTRTLIYRSQSRKYPASYLHQ